MSIGEKILIVGIFSPVISWCGGAELVAVSMINSLKEQGHTVIVLSNQTLNQSKFKDVFGSKVFVDQQIIFPLHFFSPTDYRNIYTDIIRSLMLKFKCDVVIDVHSNAVLLGADICYIHYPLLKRLESTLPFPGNNIYFYPYRNFLKSCRRNIESKLIFANSKFTAQAVKAEFGVNPQVLYPPISSSLSTPTKKEILGLRDNNVVTVARISKEKNLSLIPSIARLTRKDISFTIIGLLDSKEVLSSVLTLIKQHKLSNRIKILTNLKRDRLRRILLTSKVYLHTSVNEHFGISIVEAMSLGCTPIVHNSGGPMEFVSQDHRFNNKHEAAEKVEKAVDDWSETQALKISKYARRFNVETFSTQFIDIFQSHFDNYK